MGSAHIPRGRPRASPLQSWTVWGQNTYLSCAGKCSTRQGVVRTPAAHFEGERKRQRWTDDVTSFLARSSKRPLRTQAPAQTQGPPLGKRLCRATHQALVSACKVLERDRPRGRPHRCWRDPAVSPGRMDWPERSQNAGFPHLLVPGFYCLCPNYYFLMN